MTSHETLYDFMARRFRAMARPTYPLERIIQDAEEEGFVDVWDMPHHGIHNAMRKRGLEVANGLLSLPEIGGENFDPIADDYAEFKKIAKTVMKESDVPLSAGDLVERCGLSRAAVPLADMKRHLRKVGIHFIEGVGYWKHSQYVMPDGRILSRRCRSERVEALNRHFERHGYPVVGPDIERATSGLVTSRFLTLMANQTTPPVVSVGSGLYIPTGVETGVLPLSRQTAAMMLAVEPGMRITDNDALLIFRIASMMERKGLARIKRSRTTDASVAKHMVGKRERKTTRVQTMWITYTAAGRALLQQLAKPASDEY